MDGFIRPDSKSKCSWHAHIDKNISPHMDVPLPKREKIMPNVLHAIGQTPLVKLNKIPKIFNLQCDMFVKCEYFNPGGSVKDRIAYRMITEAEKKGLLKPDTVIIEPTSGNTGIGLALVAAVKGYRCLIVMPEKMSNEKVDTLRALGAEIVRTPSAAAFDSPDGLIAVAQRLHKEIPNSIILDQYRNAANPLAHYDTTAMEIFEQCDGKVDMVVNGAGTGGTLTGIGRRMKELCPKCIIVGTDPVGSILAEPAELNKTDTKFFEVEGIGYDFNPTVLDKSVVTKWVKVTDKESLIMAKRLIRDEGLLCGGSSGTAMAGAVKVAATLKKGQRCVVILPDGIRNYMTKHLSDHWMEARDLLSIPKRPEIWWWTIKLINFDFELPTSITTSTTCQDALHLMQKLNCDLLPIVDNNKYIKGLVTLTQIMTNYTNSNIKMTDGVDKVIIRLFTKVTQMDPMGKIARILQKEPFVIVVKPAEKDPAEMKLVGIINNMDLMEFMFSKSGQYVYSAIEKTKNCRFKSINCNLNSA